MSGGTLDRLERLHAEATPGPWGWFGNTKSQFVYLATHHFGRRFVMDFVRLGMQSAQPRFRTAPGDEGLMVPATELARYEVLGGRTEAAARETPYRHDIVGFDNPDATLIVAARNALPALLAVARAAERFVAAESHNSHPYQEFEALVGALAALDAGDDK